MNTSTHSQAVIVQFDFPFFGPWGDELAEKAKPLAEYLADAYGLIWKIWTENPQTNRAGGIYLFADKPSAKHFAENHQIVLYKMGITEDIVCHIFEINQKLSQLTRGPISNVMKQGE